MREELQEKIAAGIQAAHPGAELERVEVTVDGNRALIEVVSPVFADMNRVGRQQAVYACIEDYIADGRLHAVTIKAGPPPA